MKAAPARSKIQLKNILFATDFSPASANALPFAAELAKHFGAKLFAVHAKTPENYALPTTEVWPAANLQSEENKIELRRNMYNRFPGVESDVLIAEGGVWEVLEAIVKEKEADLIVVGTNGRRGIGKFILGSTAEEILRRAACPVLTVGPHSLPDAPREVKFRTIVYATNFGVGSPAVAAYAVALAEEYEAHLTILHVIEHPGTGELVGPRELEEGALEHLRALVPRDEE
jgi:nucleotide-binding universal stress UspA family protein